MRAQQQQVGEEKYWKASKYIADKTRLLSGGLVAIGVVILAAFIQIGVFTTSTGTPPSKELDIAALISVIAFALALPLLSVVLLASFEEASRKFIVKDTPGLQIAYWIGIILAPVGIAAAIWHVHFGAGIAVLVSIVLGVFFYTSYGRRVNRLDSQLRERGDENIRSEEATLSPEATTKGNRP